LIPFPPNNVGAGGMSCFMGGKKNDGGFYKLLVVGA